MRRLLAVLALSVGIAAARAPRARAAEPVGADGTPGTASPARAGREGLLRVFLDCPESTCDAEYFRTEIAFVDFVRDREDADLHVLVTTETTGSGGTEYTLALIGRGRFVAAHDKLTWIAAAQATRDEIRRGLVSTLELGLVRYAEHTTAAPRLAVTYDAPGTESPDRVRDPWKAWTFRVATNASFHGEQSLSDRDVEYSASANRVVDEWKFSLGGSGTYSESHYQLPGPPVTNYTSIARSYRGGGDVVKSVTPHVSARAFLVGSSSTYTNEAFAASAVAGVEYDLFPYSESTRRLVALRYYVGEHYLKYGSETVYGYLDQYAPSQQLTMVLASNQPWGEVGVVLSASNYFLQQSSGIDTSKNSLYGSTSLNLKVARGLSVEVVASGALVHDQIFLAKQGATDAEVLLERRQLETSFNYSTSVGLVYTFGSIYSAVVNPRFGSAPFFN